MDSTETTMVRPQSRWRTFFENVFYIAIAAGLAILVQAFIARPFIVNGTSMDPTFKNGDYLIIDEVTYRFHSPERGDVVVFKAPPEPSKYYIKRVIGLPGETVKITGTKVTIINEANPDGLVLAEDFITHPQSNSMTFQVPANEYFVMGDNRSGSYDSRAWGGVPIANIRGRTFLRLLPINHLGAFPGEQSYDEKN